MEVLHVGLAAILGVVAVPGREVDAEAQPVTAAGVGELTHQVALSIAPRRALHAVVGIGRGPEAEAVVVLGRQHDPLHAGRLERADPLVAVQSRGVEGRGGRIAVAPLHVVEGVESVVDEGVGFEALPGQLPGIGHGTYGCGRLHAGAGAGKQQKKRKEMFHRSGFWVRRSIIPPLPPPRPGRSGAKRAMRQHRDFKNSEKIATRRHLRPGIGRRRAKSVRKGLALRPYFTIFAPSASAQQPNPKP